VVLVLVGVTCTGSGDRGGAPPSQAFTVEVDGKADGFSAGFTAFFPDQVTVHPGDNVTVKLNAASGGRVSLARSHRA
jgi:plastocyanin